MAIGQLQNKKAQTIITSLFIALFAVAILVIFTQVTVSGQQNLANEVDVAVNSMFDSASIQPSAILASSQETGTTTLPAQDLMNLPIMFAPSVVGTSQDDPEPGTTTLPTVTYMFMPILEKQ